MYSALPLIHQQQQTMTRTKIQAQYLKKGDVLAFNSGVVTSAPYADLSTPSGKVKLGVNGYLKIWNKRTEISIINEN